MHTGYYFGTFLAAIVNYTVGAHYGWRAVFAVGGAPALLVAFIRYGVRESNRWEHRVAALDRRWTARDAFFALFSPEYRRRTSVNAALLFISMVGLWAGSAYVPSSITYLARAKASSPRPPRAWPPGPSCCSPPAPSSDVCWSQLWPSRIGRRGALAFYFAPHVRLHRPRFRLTSFTSTTMRCPGS